MTHATPPVVGFSLETLTSLSSSPEAQDASTRQAAIGALECLQLIPRLRAQSVVITEDKPRAAAILAEASLTVDEIYEERRTRPPRSEVLARLGAWAYVGSQSSDMRAARAAGVFAIGVISQNCDQKQLRRAGADKVIPDLRGLLPILKLDPLNYYTPRELSSLFDIPTRTALEWVDASILPMEQGIVNSHKKYPRTFIERALAFSGGNKPRFREVGLCFIEWAVEHGSWDQSKAATKQLNTMIQEGAMLTSSGMASVLGYEEHTVARWIKKGFLPGIRVGKTYYSHITDVHHVKKIIDGYTKEEVAQRLGIHMHSVTRLNRQGKLAATKTPNGLRITKDDLGHYSQSRNAALAAQEEMWQAPKVKEILDIPQSTLNSWCDKGALPFSMAGKRRQFNPNDVLDLKRKLQQVNHEFEWVTGQDIGAVCSTTRASRILGVNSKTIGSWSDEGLLPFQLASPVPSRNDLKQYLSTYIDALAAYAGTLPVSRQAARQFSEACRKAGKILNTTGEVQDSRSDL